MKQYKIIHIDYKVDTSLEERNAQLNQQNKNSGFWSKFTPDDVTYRKRNPAYQQLLDGTYRVEHGWEIVSHQGFSDGISLLLVQEVLDVLPYRT